MRLPTHPPLRLFAALELPPEIRRHLADMLAAVRPLLPRGEVRWVRSESIHLTLRFYGSVEQSRLIGIHEALAGCAADSKSMQLVLGKGGFFPPSGQTRVVWIGLEGDLARLEALQQAVEGSARRLGFRAETRPFRPHLTLGRVAGKLTAVDRQRITSRVEECGQPAPFVVSMLSLMRSELHPEGSLYHRQFSAPLGG